MLRSSLRVTKQKVQGISLLWSHNRTNEKMKVCVESNHLFSLPFSLNIMQYFGCNIREWWCTPVIPALRERMWDDLQVQASLGDMESHMWMVVYTRNSSYREKGCGVIYKSRPAWATRWVCGQPPPYNTARSYLKDKTRPEYTRVHMWMCEHSSLSKLLC